MLMIPIVKGLGVQMLFHKQVQSLAYQRVNCIPT